MATFKLKLFKTNFRRDENCIYDDLETALATFTSEEIPNFQYLKQTNNIFRTIKIDYAQSYYADGIKNWDYLKATNNETGNVIYYYVNGIKWLSEQTAELSLEMDVLNTYRKFCQFTDNTHITRKFKDRWHTFHLGSETGPLWLRPAVDYFPETIDVTPLKRTSKSEILGNSWKLIYLTEKDATIIENNPITCVAIPDFAISTKQTEYDGMNTLAEGYYYFLSGNYQLGASIVYYNRAFQPKLFTVSSNNEAVCLQKSGDNFKISLLKYDYDANRYVWGTVETIIAWRIIGASFLYVVKNSNISIEDAYDNLSKTDTRNLDEITTTYEIPGFKEWYRANITNPNLAKIIDLPYPPFAETYSDGYFEIPSGWIIDCSVSFNGLKKIQDVLLTSEISDTINHTALPISTFKTSKRNDDYETKLLNSNYHSIKYTYDNLVYEFQEEYALYDSNYRTTKKTNITFYAASELSSNIAFQFNVSGMKYDNDYAEWMFSTRDLSLPYYTNEYLNYVKYGKSYDERNLIFSLSKGAVSGLGSAVTTGASMWALSSKISGSSIEMNTIISALGGDDYGASKVNVPSALGLGVGAAVSVANLGIAAATASTQMSKKLNQLQHQSSTASTDNSMSIFSTYTDNKIQKFVYDLEDTTKTMLARYFDYYGYATNEYGQLINSRYWNDYFIADVEFSKDCLLSEMFKNAVKEKYSSGVRIYHWHDEYDLNLENNNYETSIEA